MHKRLFILLAFLLKATWLSAAVGPPSLRCISVKDTAGDIILTWQPPQDPLNEFFSYHIYTSTSPTGPFTDIATLTPLGLDTYTHAGANGATSPRYYYIRTFYGPGGSLQSAPSDTLKTMILNVAAPSISTASLSWNNIHEPPLSTSLKFYIYRDPDSLLADSTLNLSLTDTVFRICDTTRIFYRVVLKDSYGCFSISAPGKNFFRDYQPPPLTRLEKVSVDYNTNRPYIVWYPNRAKDVQGYWVLIDPNAVNIATAGKNDISYTDAARDASAASYSYRVAAFDSCTTKNGVPQLGPYENSHSTILLNAALDICSGRIELSWSKYVNWRSGVSRYNVYQSFNGGPYTQLTQTDYNTTSFTVTGLVNNSAYRFYVEAWDGSGAINSNSNSTKTIQYSTSSIPSYLTLTSTLIDKGTQKPVISWNSDPSALLNGFKILRSSDSILFDTVSFVQKQPGESQTFTDLTADPKKVYYYKVIAIDTCRNTVKTSEAANTMVSVSYALEDFKNHISWNSFNNWNGDLFIYRSISGVWDPAPLTYVSSSMNMFIDTNLTSYLSSSGLFCYYLEARNPDGSKRGTSNISCLRQTPKVYVPNTFIPSSAVEANRIFKPFNVFVNGYDYRLVIYNRWGMKIFVSHDPNEGWDGMSGGVLQPAGVYAYDLHFFLADGTLFEKTGSITLLR
jgi:hypothetical protein